MERIHSDANVFVPRLIARKFYRNIQLEIAKLLHSSTINLDSISLISYCEIKISSFYERAILLRINEKSWIWKYHCNNCKRKYFCSMEQFQCTHDENINEEFNQHWMKIFLFLNYNQPQRDCYYRLLHSHWQWVNQRLYVNRSIPQ